MYYNLITATAVPPIQFRKYTFRIFTFPKSYLIHLKHGDFKTQQKSLTTLKISSTNNINTFLLSTLNQ